MTSEEIELTIQFIVGQQALFVTDLQQLRESHAKLTDAVLTILGVVGKLAEAQARSDARVAELAQKGKETEERLHAFIASVERYISEDRNGKR